MYSFKERLKKEKGSVQVRLDKVLLAYRNASHNTTGVSLAGKFLGFSLRTTLDLVLPNRPSKQYVYKAKCKTMCCRKLIMGTRLSIQRNLEERLGN